MIQNHIQFMKNVMKTYTYLSPTNHHTSAGWLSSQQFTYDELTILCSIVVNQRTHMAPVKSYIQITSRWYIFFEYIKQQFCSSHKLKKRLQLMHHGKDWSRAKDNLSLVNYEQQEKQIYPWLLPKTKNSTREQDRM